MKNRKTDLNYISNGFFVTFLPNTDAGREAWNEMRKHDENAKFPIHMLPSIKQQLKKAGYSVRKEPKNNMSIDQILVELS